MTSKKVKARTFVCDGCSGRKCVRSVIGAIMEIVTDEPCDQTANTQTNWISIKGYELFYTEPQIKEISLASLEKEQGCKVKITK